MQCLLVAATVSACGRADDTESPKGQSTKPSESLVTESEPTDVSALESGRSADACAKTDSAAATQGSTAGGTAAPECKDSIVVDGNAAATHHPGLVFPE
jgi:hypothetical protein